MTVAIIVFYLILVLSIGLFSHRYFRATGEDFFVATRTIGPFILLASLFGTHMTAFSLLGASGESYLSGIGVFGLMASSSAIVVPAVFFFIGIRVWSLGKEHGYLTQIQFIRDRWSSDFAGLLLFLLFLALLIPYLLIGVMGAGITLNQITQNAIPEWIGSLGICLVIAVYVTYGGMRGTAWVNTFQTLVFMTLGGIAFFVVVNRLGGLGGALETVAANHPDLLIRGTAITPMQMLTYTLIPLSVGTFPHIFMHWLTARQANTFRTPIIYYPIFIAIVWVPSVLMGILGRVNFPDLAGPEANSVLLRMIVLHAPEFLAGLLAAGVFAAVMSSLDSQILCLGSMFTEDIVRHYGFDDQMSDRLQVLAGRIFVFLLLAIVFLLSLVTNRSIFKLGIWSFSGFAALFPIIVAGLYWKRSTKAGVVAATLTVAVLWLFFLQRGWSVANYTIGGTGILPVFVMLVASVTVLVAVSLVTRAPDEETLKRFFPDQ